MEKMELEDFDQELPDRMNLAVIMEKQRAFPGHGPESATTSGRMRELLP
jgi:hypothetical protein